MATAKLLLILNLILNIHIQLIQSTIHYNVGVLMASRLDSPFDLERCAPAVDLALEDVNKNLLATHNVKLLKVQASYPSCSGAIAPGLAADMFFKDNVIAFVGPACAFALDPVARLAAYWNRPIITGMGDQPPSEGQLSVTSGILGRLQKWKNDSNSGIFKDKSEYPTLTRMSYCQCRLKIVFSSIFNEFGWKHVALILDRSDLFSLIVGKNLESGLKKNGLLSFVRELDGNDDDWKCDQLLKDASMYARVVILSVRGFLVRKFMLAAHSMGMTRGGWTFLDVEIVQGSYWGDHDWENGDGNDAAARKAYESLLRVSLLEPTSASYHDFSELVKERARKHYNYTYSAGEEVNFFVGAFYDGVQLLGMALNETLTMGLDLKDGKSITKLMWNRSFHGITGDVRIDENGDRDADYSILDLDPISGKFEVVAHYYGITRQYTPVSGKKIHWPGEDGPMPDIPLCGFMGNDPKCHKNDPFSIIVYSCSAFAVVLSCMIALACLANKQMKHLADLNNMSWKIKPSEVLLELNRPYSSRINLQKPDVSENNCVQIFEPLIPDRYFRRKSNDSNCSLLGTHVYTNVGIFKGVRVAIKKVVKKKVDINKKLLWEIKQVRDITHENTVRFVGACIEYPCILILTEYCPKGSLKDVLQNEQLKLDWNFRMCLIHDIVKGMTYLHSSELGIHGKLRSSNCLIDGRFVVKISDFGLSILTTPSEIVKDANFYNKLLWVAPELLPVTVLPGSPATQKGDVFSFSIILEEIVLRGGPYEVAKQFLSTEDP
uniref:guanylate cyclase n=2 Tax=Cacopsylla melanoneura TaxID=428564 RepID=A0A8D9APV7_9HEMI